MSMELFLLLVLLAVALLATWGADKSLRKRDEDYIHPMSDEDERINEILRNRRLKK